jgi:hypothetical protein
MPNNVSMNASAHDVISLIGRPSDAARFFQVKPPSVAEWIDKGVIPEDRLIRYAARLEAKSHGRFSRVDAFPHDFHLIWPELAALPKATLPDERPSLHLRSDGTLTAGERVGDVPCERVA